MGKKNLNKYKKYKKKKNLDQEEYEEKIKSNTEKKWHGAIFKDIPTLLQKLTNSQFDELNHITSILSSFEFSNIKEPSISDIFISPQIISALANLLNNEYYQIKYNAICSLTNILISYSDTDVDKILILNTDFCKYSMEIIKEFTKVDKGSKEYIKRIRTLKNLLDLCMLIIDMTESDNLINNNFINIIFQFLDLMINNTDLISEDLLEHINQFLGSVFSTIVIQIDKMENKEYSNIFKTYIEKMNNLFNNKETSNSTKANIGFILFYINLINFDYLKQNNINLLPGLIEYSFNELTKDNIINNLNTFSDLILSIEKEKNSNDIETKKNEQTNDDVKSKGKMASDEINSLLNNLKIFQEIITTIEEPISNSNSKKENDNNINMDEYEEIDEDNFDSEMKNSDLFDDLISKALNEILSVNNYEPLKKMISQKIMNNLSLLCNVQNKLQDYYINDNDKILQMNEALGEIEYMSLSIINNIIIKYHNFLNAEYINSLYAFLGQKMNQLISNVKDNEYFLSLVILTLRTLLDKYNGNFKNFGQNDYLNLFNIIEKVNDNFIKCNVIDIISLCACVDNNFKIGEDLKKLLFSENDIEVLSHVINAFMDVFKNDDLESNQYLKQIGVMDLFSKAVPEFKNKFKKAKKEGKMEQESIDYCKDTFLNMKRFIKYKQDNFKQLKI